MANADQFEILLRGVEAWNAWRRDNPLTPVDLSDAFLPRLDFPRANFAAANLRGTHLRGANLERAELRGANISDGDLNDTNLSGADLRSANLEGAIVRRSVLEGADLVGAKLGGADLAEADLDAVDLRMADIRGANLEEVDLRSANLSGSTLAGADMYRTELWNTVFANMSLDSVQGLDTCVHRGPSILDIGTIVRSPGLPRAFLRGCGVPESFIEQLPLLLGTTPPFYSCFISYATADQAFADRLHGDLQNNGVRCWFAPRYVKGGLKLHDQIDTAIRAYDKLLLILSPASMASEWVRTEIAKARKREVQEGRRVLFPIRLVDFDTLREWVCFDADTGKDSAREVREYFIPDFSQWTRPEHYDAGFERLLRDLRQGGEPKSSSVTTLRRDE